MDTGREFREHLQSSPAAIAYRLSWEGKAFIHFGGMGLTIQRQGDQETYPYAFSFEDLTADDWELR